MNYESQSADRKFPNWRRRMVVGAVAAFAIGGGIAMDISDNNGQPDKTLLAVLSGTVAAGIALSFANGQAPGESPDWYGNKPPADDDTDNE